MITVMITGCGAHSKKIHDYLHYNEDHEDVRIVGVNANEKFLVRTGVDAPRIVPMISEDNYLDEMLRVCKEEHVDVILPFITRELPVISQYKKEFAGIGVKLSICDPETIALVNNKAELAKKIPYCMPKQVEIESPYDIVDFSREIGYPENKYCCKMSNAQGGKGFTVIDEEKAKRFDLINLYGSPHFITQANLIDMCTYNKGNRMMLQEYIEGTDYSVCVLANNGKVEALCGFYGYVISYGSTVSGEIAYNKSAYDIATEVTGLLGLDGNICFDFRVKENGEAVLLEINPRLNSTIGFVCEAGLNLPYMRACQLMGKNIEHLKHEPKYGLKFTRFYDEEFYV